MTEVIRDGAVRAGVDLALVRALACRLRRGRAPARSMHLRRCRECRVEERWEIALKSRRKAPAGQRDDRAAARRVSERTDEAVVLPVVAGMA